MAENRNVYANQLPQNDETSMPHNNNVNPGNSLRVNYIVNTGLQSYYNDNINNYPDLSPIDIVQNDNIYGGFLRLAPLIANANLNNRKRMAYVEFLQFVEVQINSFIKDAAVNISRIFPLRRNSMVQLINTLSRPDATTRFLSNSIRNVEHVAPDIKLIINQVFSSIVTAYRGSNLFSNFLNMYNLLEYEGETNNVRWFHRLNREIEISPSLRLLIQIVMLRFPSMEIRNNDFNTIMFEIEVKRINEEGMKEFSSRRMSIKVLQDAKRNLSFYYLPSIKRVVGVWPKNIKVKNNTEESTQNYIVNYQVDLIRNCILEIRKQNGYIPDFSRLFFDQEDNIYMLIRKKDPFSLRGLDKKTRLYVTLSIYGAQNLPLFFVPWVLEGSTFSGRPYDIREFINEYNYQLEKNYSNKINSEDDIDNNEVYYLHFSWLYDERKIDISVSNSESRNNRNRTLQQRIQNIDIDEEADIIDDEEEAQIREENKREEERRVNRPIRRNRNFPPRAPAQQPVPVVQQNRRVRNNRGSRELRSLGITPSTNTRTTRSSAQAYQRTTRSGLRLGAPYTGTLKEKHFFEASIINKFTNSAALFKTPETNLNCCLMMSLIRAQLYCYKFENNKCVELKITGTKHVLSKCNNMYVESYNNYDNIPYNYPFLEKIEGKWFIKLFEPGKLKINDKFVEGCVDKIEEDYWLTASEEIWFHLQQYFKREIDYNNVDDYCQAFSDYFKVCISLYDIETRATRVHVYRPGNMTPREIIARYNHLLMVHIVYDQGHAHCISSFPSFIKKEARKDSLRLYNYCPICEEQQIKELRTTSEESFKHITKCCLKKDFVIKKDDMINEMIMSNISKVKNQFKKVNNKTKIINQCCQCYEEVDQKDWMKHDCYIKKKKSKTIEEDKIYVYDLEACQITDQLGLLKHECNCLYVRKVYCNNEIEEQGLYFPGEFEFVESLIADKTYENCVFIAHNGGSYDIHFLLRILERCEIQHSFVPSPTSKHKFIQILITHNDLNIRFIDFMRFIPGSLKNIALAFEIPVSKGDFPHRFNNGLHDDYNGRIPILDDENDWWSKKSFRNEKDNINFTKWYNEQSLIYCTCDNICECNKQKWNFQDEIKKYCLLDVVVLAEIVKAYRNACMNFDEIEEKILNWSAPRLDPLQFMTLPQITISTFVNGFESMTNVDYDFSGVYTLSNTQRGGHSNEAIIWLYQLQLQQREKIYYLGNSMKEWYDFDLNMSFDGYCQETDTIYFFLDCQYWGCPVCMQEHNEFNEKIPLRGMYASDVSNHLQYIIGELQTKYTKVIYIWDHDFKMENVSDYVKECSYLFEPEDAFYGGRCEVFKPYCKPNDNEEIHYYDVTSLYPSVYAHHVLPLGKPIHIIGENIESIRLHPTHPDRYYGFVKCHVIPNKKDLLGLLPKRDEESGRLFFPVYPMTGCWYTTELYLAMQNGYIVDIIYEVYHWSERNRSDQHIRPYVDYFFRMKQEAEGWKKLGATSNDPTEEEKDEIVERLYIQNGNLGRIRKDKVKLNPVLRALAKLYLNSFWGKLAQKKTKSCQMTIYGSQQLLDLIHNPYVLMESCKFREISSGVYKVSFNLKEDYLPSVKHGNLFIGAAVTATARCVLHQKMISIGPERIIYCDTDSIVFKYNIIMGILTDVGLGKWTNEYPKYYILQFYGLAPKLYSLKLQEKVNENEPYETFRAKGVQLTLGNQIKLAFENIKPLIEKLVTGKKSNYTLEVDNMNIFTNSTNNALPFGQVYTRYNKKEVRAIITKRYFELVNSIDWEVVSEIQTYPFGYDLQ